MRKFTLLPAIILMLASFSPWAEPSSRMRVILDSDANNELDDQHAIAYLLLNGDVFDVAGITVNRTYNGGDLELHRQEAERVVALLGLEGTIPVISGADGDFSSIRDHVSEQQFDGSAAVDFIVSQARTQTDGPLVLLPIGKLTNIALALAKAPGVAQKVRIVWLGSNYPEPGEYNQDNDREALNYILSLDVPFEIVTVRYGKDSGTAAVTVSRDEVRTRLAGKGPVVSEPVTGRHGGAFDCFGDYALELFSNIKMRGDPPSRALFDLAAVAIVKNPGWAKQRVIPAPRLVNGQWIDREDNPRKIVLWEHFDREAILDDFFSRMDDYVLAGQPLSTANTQLRISNVFNRGVRCHLR